MQQERPLQEKALMRLLTQYINTEPEHGNGLCFWLRKTTERRRLVNLCPYALYAPLEKLPRYQSFFRPGALRVTGPSGPTPLRLAYAQWILDLLEERRLVWTHHPDTPWGLSEDAA